MEKEVNLVGATLLSRFSHQQQYRCHACENKFCGSVLVMNGKHKIKEHTKGRADLEYPDKRPELLPDGTFTQLLASPI